jgi:hypothetical protein
MPSTPTRNILEKGSFISTAETRIWPAQFWQLKKHVQVKVY